MTRKAGIFVLAAIAWWVAAEVDLETPFELSVWSDHVELTVADTTLKAEMRVRDVTGLQLVASRGLFPLGSRGGQV